MGKKNDSTAENAAVDALAEELQTWAECSWWRFCLRKESAPKMWPAEVVMERTVRSDVPGSALSAGAGRKYPVTSNRHGALCAEVDGRLLGIKPDVYEVTKWAEERRDSGQRAEELRSAAGEVAP